MTSSDGSDRNLEIRVRPGRPRRGAVAKTSKVRTVEGRVEIKFRTPHAIEAMLSLQLVCSMA